MTLTAEEMARATLVEMPYEHIDYDRDRVYEGVDRWIEVGEETYEVPSRNWRLVGASYDNMGDGTLYNMLAEEGEDECRSVADAAARLREVRAS